MPEYHVVVKCHGPVLVYRVWECADGSRDVKFWDHARSIERAVAKFWDLPVRIVSKGEI